jgi:NAD(P)-dependent dehydrogenase (short-subunit alcohol dehydrogenase family)
VNVVVVGASRGIGRCLAVWLGQHGNRVALLARREDRLATAAVDAGAGAIAVRADATDPASCERAIDRCVERLGSIDALVYAAGSGPLAPIEQVDAATWHQTFATNVVGASLVTAAALPHLVARRGVAIYLSSVTASTGPPWPGLAAYSVTKAALERLVDAWRAEHPEVGFSRVVVGDCAGGDGPAATGFADSWDPDLAARFAVLWRQRNLLSGALVDVADVCRAVDGVLHLGADATVPVVLVLPRGRAEPTG